MNQDLKLISTHLIFLHGLSGAGKSVLQKSLEEQLKDAGYRPLYLSSGDCFRALGELNPELYKKMSQGQFIQTLEGTMPLLEQTIKIFLSDLVSKANNHPILILDGFLRRDAFKVDGKNIPSQIDQIADAFIRVFKGLGRKNYSTKKISSEVIKKAWHCYVDVNDTDAECLMRIRSEKHLLAINTYLDTVSVKSEELSELRNSLEKAYKIQSNKKYRLKGVPEKLHMKFDEEIDSIVKSIFQIATQEFIEGSSVSKPIQKIINNSVSNNEFKVVIRDDDLTFKRRLKRIEEFNINTKHGVLNKITGPGFLIIKNGPSRDISLQMLEKNCRSASKKIVKNLAIA